MRFFFIFLLLPLKLFSQDLEGVWAGTIYNDTTRKYIPYEIAITENKGKLSGFSHTIFTSENNKPETGVKSLKIKKKGDKLLIEDDELIYNNYIDPPPKGVRQYSVLNLTSGPSGEYLVGAFNTNRTKEYASATGTIHLQKKEKITETKIIPKLDELKLSNSLSFIQKQKENHDVVVVNEKNNQHFSQFKQQEKEITNLTKTKNESNSIVKVEKDENLIDINEDTIDYKVDVIGTEDIIREKQKKKLEKSKTVLAKKAEITTTQSKTIIVEIKTPPVAQPNKDVAVNSIKDEKKSRTLPQPTQKVIDTSIPLKVINPVTNDQPNVIAKNIIQPPATKKVEDYSSKEKPIVISAPPKITTPVTTNQSTKAKAISLSQPAAKKAEENSSKVKTKEQVIANIPQPIQKSTPVPGTVISSEELSKRKIETIRTVDFKSDSLVLTLYDNGVVDGDTVSVIMNGKIIMPKEGLSTKAITKTIYITPDLGDSLQLIMYAENLGSIPPNTGLLIIKDGEDSYQIRFAGDLQKNSAIILRRKKNL